MSETAEVRLVRCPKCDKLLPEVTDFSVYQCGGCGAVLRAKNKGVDLDTFSEKSDEERIGGTMEKLSDRYEKIMNVSDRRMMGMSDGSESDVRSSISSSSRAERRRILRERAENGTTSLTIKEWDVEADIVQDKRSDELHRSRISLDYENMVMHHDDENGLRRSSRMVDEEKEGFGWAKRMDPTIAPSNGVSWSSYKYGDQTRNRSDVDGSNDLENIGEDRAELLRKLDELTDQLRRSGDLIDKGKEKTPHDPCLYDNGYGVAHFKRPVYQNQYSEPPPLMRRQEMGGNGFYPPRYVPQYGDPMRSHMHRRGPTPHAYTSGPYMDDGMVYMDPMEPHPTNFTRHHPSCSCHQCRSKRRVSNPVLLTAYSDKYSNVSNDMIPNYHGTPGYNQRMSMSNPPPLRSHVPQTHARWPSHVNSEVDDSTLCRPPRARLASSGKNCCPIAGGAPFLTCYNCFELLQLTKKVLTGNNSRKKLRCGGCSTVIVFAVSDKGLIVSLDVEATDSPVKFNNKSAVLSRHGDARLNQARTAFSSDDYDNSGYHFHSVDRESGQVSTCNKPSVTKDHRSTSMYTSEAEEDMESLTEVRTGSSIFADLAADDNWPAPPAGSSLQDYFEYSNKYRVAKDSGEGNRSGRSDYVKALPNKAIEKQILRKESTATEIDLSSSEYCNTGTTLDSSEASREGDNLKASRGAASFFAGIVKNSFKDSQKYKDALEQEKGNVTVNGHLIPDRLIKKAEKLAGPIHPGHYWYDFRAGFWGAIGGPCLGIVPPFIDEFNYPLQEHCAGGNTGVFVNGRELNQKDLNLLGRRGLPMERDRSYIVEISGRVLDEDTGEELESLGKLAPTVEKMKRGFGMRAPKAVV